MGGSDRGGADHVVQTAVHHAGGGTDQIGGVGLAQLRGGVAAIEPHPGDEPVGELGGDLLRADHAGSRALRNRAMEQASGLRNGEQGRHRMSAGAFPEDRDVARVPTEGGNVLPHPAQRQDDVAQEEIALDRRLR